MIKDEDKNPTEYVFNISMDSLKINIKKTFSNYRYCDYFLHSYNSEFSYFKKHIQNKQDITNDFALDYSGYIIRDISCLSKVYIKQNGKGCLYYVDYYYIHLEEADNGIKVSVSAIYPKIYLGRKLLPNPAFLTRGIRVKSVSSTTVEEYEILLMIGKTLGIENMPKIKIPKRIVINSREGLFKDPF